MFQKENLTHQRYLELKTPIGINIYASHVTALPSPRGSGWSRVFFRSCLVSRHIPKNKIVIPYNLVVPSLMIITIYIEFLLIVTHLKNVQNNFSRWNGITTLKSSGSQFYFLFGKPLNQPIYKTSLTPWVNQTLDMRAMNTLEIQIQLSYNSVMILVSNIGLSLI